MWEDEYAAFWRELGPGGHMALATSLDGEVTARTMSVVQLGGRLYFQTDRRFRSVLNDALRVLVGGIRF